MARYTAVLDFDDTLVPYNEHLCSILNERMGSNYTPDSFKDWEWRGVEKEHLPVLQSIVRSDEVLNLQSKPFEGAQDLVHWLVLHDFDVIIGTAVPLDKMSKRARQIEKFFPEVSSILMGRNKTEIACDWLLDDCAGNVEHSLAYNPCLFRKPWNSNTVLLNSGIQRVKSYEQFKSLIKRMERVQL